MPAGDGAKAGVPVLKSFLGKLPGQPGVYRMLDSKGQVLYVGKAKNLKKRVSSYANLNGLSNRIARMVMRIADLTIVTTHTEAEALLLEANLIKRYKPPFNVLLRDDKSFPYILITKGHDWPRISKHRGARSKDGSYYGPFASAGAVNRTLNALQRAFLLRTCTDSVFESRTRPCLLYQIKRCSAPCVGLIGRDEYNRMLGDARDFLRGKSRRIQDHLSEQMRGASDALEFERAAALRDRIQALTRVQARQDINMPSLGEADIIAGYQQAGQACIQVFFFRTGQNWGNRAYFPRHDKSQSLEEVLTPFVSQFYDNKPPPKLVVVNAALENVSLIEEALSVRAERRIRILYPKRGDKLKLLRHAEDNARQSLELRLAENATQRRMLEEVAAIFDLDATPSRIEVYDNSHISGAGAVGGMIVAGADGLIKNAYRKFNIKSTDLEPGDDYGMMREVMTRRFSRLVREDPARESGDWPDLVLLDGGAGQLSAVTGILAELGVDGVPLVSIAKGPNRNAGRERFFMNDRKPFSLEERSPALYFLQRLRDEAHRFAIGAHRTVRKKTMVRSVLDGIPGVGRHRKRALLNYFGSARAVAEAGLTDLEAARGISKAMAKTIYDHFHPDA